MEKLLSRIAYKTITDFHFSNVLKDYFPVRFVFVLSSR